MGSINAAAKQAMVEISTMRSWKIFKSDGSPEKSDGIPGFVRYQRDSSWGVGHFSDRFDSVREMKGETRYFRIGIQF